MSDVGATQSCLHVKKNNIATDKTSLKHLTDMLARQKSCLEGKKMGAIGSYMLTWFVHQLPYQWQ